MNAHKEQAERWIWFLDVVFGAIVALGIQKYEPVVRAAWSQGIDTFLLSIFVAISICSFVVYDIAVYHTLAKKFPYHLSTLGFVRFYLDLVMAFILYVFLSTGLQKHPAWDDILIVLTFWHVAAVIWHLLARREHRITRGIDQSLVPHVIFLGIYWGVAIIGGFVGTVIVGLDGLALSNLILVVVSVTILGVSLFRWNQVLRQVVAQ